MAIAKIFTASALIHPRQRYFVEVQLLFTRSIFGIMSFDWIKWRLLLKILPLTLLFGLAKFSLYQLGWQPWAFDSLTASLFGAVTFVVAFILSGTVNDYNASEEMPLQLVNSIETIQDSSFCSAMVHPDYDPQPLTADLTRILETVWEWLKHEKQLEEIDVEAAITQLNLRFAELEPFSSAPIISRLQTEQAKMRLLITRMQLHRDTDFLAPAYALLEFFLVGAVLALLLIEADRPSENLVVSSFLFTSFTYLLILIRDLDNPFQYDGKSSVDVDLTILETTRDRLHQKLTQLITASKPIPESSLTPSDDATSC